MVTTRAPADARLALIVEQAASALGAPVGIVNARGLITASSEARRIGDPDTPSLAAAASVRAPLSGYDGAQIVVDLPDPTDRAARLAQAYLDLVGRQFGAEARPDRQRLKGELIQNLLFSTQVDEELAQRQGEMLGVDLRLPRAIILVDASACLPLTVDGERPEQSAAQAQLAIQRVIQSIVNYFHLPSAYEILVVDDGASKATCQLVERYARWAGASGPHIRYLAVTRAHGPAAARNAGWRAARTPVIAFTDDDCIPSPGWLRAGLEAMRNEMVAGASGRLVMPLPAHPTDYELNAARLAGGGGQFITANCFYRRSALELVGGFDERFTAACREDSDLQFTLMERCMVLVFAPEAVVTHPIRLAPWHVSLSQQRRNIFNPLLYKKHAALYRTLVQSTPPWRYYAILATLLGALAGMLTRRPRVALAGGALWALLTGAFCARRLAGTSHAPRHVAAMLVTSARSAGASGSCEPLGVSDCTQIPPDSYLTLGTCRSRLPYCHYERSGWRSVASSAHWKEWFYGCGAQGGHSGGGGTRFPQLQRVLPR